jgi:rhodanese-related sulfurtransferase
MLKGYKALVDEAMAQVKTYSVAEVQTKLADPTVQLVDVRDIRELEREGIVPGAYHVPRGMIEFWVDPDSPYFKPVFGEKKEFIFSAPPAGAAR